MAKPDKETKKAAAPAKEEFKYGVEDIAEGLDIKAASARVQLRNSGIKKSGKSYGWNSKAEVEEVLAKLKKGSAKTEKKAETKTPKKLEVKKSAKKTEDKAA